MFFTLSGITLNADTHKYLRIKSIVNGGGMDGMFFATSESGFSGSKTRIPFSSANAVSASDGMTVYEYDITKLATAKDYWHGTVTSLRYDAVGSAASEGATDYITFSENKGIYKAFVTVNSPSEEEEIPQSAVLSPESACCSIKSVVWDKQGKFEKNTSYTVTITLTPNDGYEFIEEDIMSTVGINGSLPDTAKVLADGSLELTKTFAPMTPVIKVGNTQGNTKTSVLDFGAAFTGKTVVAAVYNSDGKMISCTIEEDFSTSDGKAELIIGSSDSSESAVVMVFEDSVNFKPFCESRAG